MKTHFVCSVLYHSREDLHEGHMPTNQIPAENWYWSYLGLHEELITREILLVNTHPANEQNLCVHTGALTMW